MYVLTAMYFQNGMTKTACKLISEKMCIPEEIDHLQSNVSKPFFIRDACKNWRHFGSDIVIVK